VVQRSTRTILGGNGRFRVMQQLGWIEADIVLVDLDDAQAAALSIALNRTAALATWDLEMLTSLLDELKGDELLEAAGYTEADLTDLVKELEAAKGPKELEDPGEGPPPANPASRIGDLWVLGDHQLLCGDATKLADVKRLLGGRQAQLVATDPPYLVNYTGERPNHSGKDWSESYREIDINDANGFFRAVFVNILDVLAPSAAIYCWHAHKRSGEIQAIWKDLGILDHQQIVWVKPTAVFGRVYWHFRHEPCMMGWRQGSKPDHNGQHEFDSVWEVDWEGKARVQTDHPMSKPAELFARPMRKHTKVGDLVFEPFSGSGSQLIAAERERRVCRAIEISPPFVDVAIERWQTATGKPAMLEGANQPFDAVKRERLGAVA
jgi:DNA modification methylase